MAIFRARVGMSFTSWPSIHTFPEVGCSRPAMILSNVDLPHPDGPTTVTTSRSRISSETSVKAAKPAKARLTLSMRIEDIPYKNVFTSTVTTQNLNACVIFLSQRVRDAVKEDRKHDQAHEEIQAIACQRETQPRHHDTQNR